MDFVSILLLAISAILLGLYIHWLSYCVGDGWYSAKFKRLEDFVRKKI